MDSVGGGLVGFGSLLVGCGALRLVTVVMGLRCQRRSSGSPVVCGFGVWWNSGYGGDVDRLEWFTVERERERRWVCVKVFFFLFTICTPTLLSAHDFFFLRSTPFLRRVILTFH